MLLQNQQNLRYNSDPSSKRREGGGFDIRMVSVDVIEHVDGFTIRMTTDDDVFDVVDDTGKLKNCWLSCNSVLWHHGTRKKIEMK